MQIADISVGEGSGIIGVSFCPGKHQPAAMSGSWARDLDVDLDAVAAWGAAAVVTLIELDEMAALKVKRMDEAVAARDIAWFHLAIRDVTAPGPSFEAAWQTAGPEIRAMLREDRNVFVHCKGGLGRAGTIAARLLVELGWEPSHAIAAVRAARPGAIETPAQEAHVRAIKPIVEHHCSTSGDLAVEDRAIGCLLGLAIGDAVGTTLEFRPRDTYEHLTDMVGGGPFQLRPGEWTDDTAMALALADSLTDRDAVDLDDLMRRFVSWWREGTYSCTGQCFDIGSTTRSALARFERTGEPMAGATDPHSAGNGSLMRLAPVAIWGAKRGVDKMRAAARAQSATTHGAATCLDACEGYALIIRAAILGASFEQAVTAASTVTAARPIDAILAGSWRGKQRHEIKASGYVAHSLEAALWCVAETDNFRDAILLAANLGEDADTTAATAGQLAGALYGASQIPEGWRSSVAWRRSIEKIAKGLL